MTATITTRGGFNQKKYDLFYLEILGFDYNNSNDQFAIGFL